MRAHILNGDALASKFHLSGDIIVCREAFINGPVSSTGDEFWNERARYIANTYDIEEHIYYADAKSEFEKLLTINAEELNLWFENDLFCQANMWFLLHFLKDHKIEIPLFRVMPLPNMSNIWTGFGRMEAHDLENCFNRRVQIKKEDIQLGVMLWDAFAGNQFDTLKQLSENTTPAYPYLREVCEAHIQRFPIYNGRPQNRLREILKGGFTDFNYIFKEFSKTEGIYGFGDLQVKEILTTLN